MHSSAFRPLVDRIRSIRWGVFPSMHWARGYLPGGCLLGETPPVDRQTPVKTYPSQTSFAGGKNCGRNAQITLPSVNLTCFQENELSIELLTARTEARFSTMEYLSFYILHICNAKILP